MHIEVGTSRTGRTSRTSLTAEGLRLNENLAVLDIHCKFAVDSRNGIVFGKRKQQESMENDLTRGSARFAPSPSGRMHLGNAFTALISWLSARKAGRRWILRIEDLDPQRSKQQYALQIEDDLRWLGLDWDEGGTAGRGPSGPYSQSLRGEIYNDMLERLREQGVLYPCFCKRADIMATQAPHQTDGRIVYAGTCRPERMAAGESERRAMTEPHALRVRVPDEEISFTDRVFGRRSVVLPDHCGDFVVRRADGAWAYQLAVVADDALMGVTEVVRGCDLLLSTAQQLYLYRLLGFDAPEFAHVPLLVNEAGLRLSKRDSAASLGSLRERGVRPQGVIGRLACAAGIIDRPEPVDAAEIIEEMDWRKIKPQEAILTPPVD